MMPGGSLLTSLTVGGIQIASAKETSDAVTDAIAGEKENNSQLHKRRRHRTRLRRKRIRRRN